MSSTLTAGQVVSSVIYKFRFCVRHAVGTSENKKQIKTRRNKNREGHFQSSVCVCVCVRERETKGSNKTRIMVQNTQETKRTLSNWTKQDKTCKFSRCPVSSNLKSVLLISCVLDLFSQRWQSTRFQIFLTRINILYSEDNVFCSLDERD